MGDHAFWKDGLKNLTRMNVPVFQIPDQSKFLNIICFRPLHPHRKKSWVSDLSSRASDLMNGGPGVLTSVGMKPLRMSKGPVENIVLMFVRGPPNSLCMWSVARVSWMCSGLLYLLLYSLVQLLSCVRLCDPMDCSSPGFPVHHQLPNLTQTHVLQVGDAIQPSHPLSSPSPPAFDLFQHQGLFQCVGSSHQMARVVDRVSLFCSLSQGEAWIGRKFRKKVAVWMTLFSLSYCPSLTLTAPSLLFLSVMCLQLHGLTFLWPLSALGPC